MYNGSQVFWKDGKWHSGSQDGPEILPDTMNKIQYEYLSDSNSITACTFENAYKEGGEHEEP